MAIVISAKISEKLSLKHGVSEDEVHQCFANVGGSYLMDTREEHATDAPTYWFISETDLGRKLKVVFVHKGGDNFLRTAYEPNEAELRIYEKHGQ